MSNNLKSPPIIEAPLNVLGGLYTECDPNDLPPGASPRATNCDFRIGSVLKRPGLKSSFYFLNFFVEKICGFAQSIADGPNEVPWSNPINATKGIPGTYASVALNTSTAAVDGIAGVDVAPVIGSGDSDPVRLASQTPTGAYASDFAIFNQVGFVGGGFDHFTPDPGWSSFLLSFGQIVTGPIAAGGTQAFALGRWTAACVLLGLIGNTAPVLVQPVASGTETLPWSDSFGSETQAGSTILVQVLGPYAGAGGDPGLALTDDAAGGSNVYHSIGTSFTGNKGIDSCVVYTFACFNAKPCKTIFVAPGGANPAQGPLDYEFAEYPTGQPGAPSLPVSEELQCLNFGLNIPATQNVVGFQLEVTGKQTDLDPRCILVAKPLDGVGPSFPFQLPSVEGQVVIGTPTENWGHVLSPAVLNNSSFGLEIQASSPEGIPCTFDISAVKIKVFLSPNPAPSFNYLKTFEQEAGEIRNLLLDSNGIMWEEDPLNLPGALNEVYDQILPNTFAQSTTEDNREFIALSNLLNGTDIPYTYNGVNFDRCSQIGPGAAPTVTTTSAGSAVTSITQTAAFPLPTGSHDWLLCSDSPADIGNFGTPKTPGNVFVLIFDQGTPVPAQFTPGSNIFLTGFPTINGNRLNNDASGTLAPKFYTITSVGQKIAGQQSYDAITFTVPFTTFYNAVTPGGCAIQSTIATMKTAVQVPNLEVGDQFTLDATGGGPPAGYDGTWTVLTTPNASQFQVTATSLTNNTATYSYILQTGTNPAVGQAVTVTLTLNGNGRFNVTNAIITAASAGSFSINLVSANILSAAETGAGIVFGTIFTFDAFEIIGNKSGGNVETTGIIGTGVRKCCYSFLTRNGFISQPSPIATFNVTEGSGKIAVANLQPGPSDTIARIVFFTAGDGSFFYWIAQPVVVAGLTGNITNTATIVNDNVTTNALFSFSDNVLLGTAGAGGQADVQGSNYFETKELGACRGFVQYGGRIFAIGEQNKVSNFRGLSFDGGIGVIQSQSGAGGGAGVNLNYPLGWTIDQLSTGGQGVGVSPSPIFGNAYTITNSTGSTQAVRGLIIQPAFQDEFSVPIINASTTYSVRVTLSINALNASTSGGFLVDLASPALGRSLGFFTVLYSQMTTNMQIFTGVLLTQSLAPVPNDLQLRCYCSNMPDGVVVTVDRVEPFPTEKPNLDRQLIGSYQQNFEAFDRVTGIIDGNTTNQQPINAAFVLFDTLYMVKTKTILGINSVAGQEPAQWGEPRTVSQACGTDSVYGVTTDDQGQEWAIIAGKNGGYLFTGGEPIPITEEITQIWNTINWKYGYTLQVKNDVVNRRVLFFVPLKIPAKDANGNFPSWYHPALNLSANPTTPNVCLALSYKQLFTAGELGDRIEVHASSYTGKLLTIDVSRKWSMWTVAAPASGFLEQADGTDPLFVGNSAGTGKAYQFVETLLDDDGAAVEQRYCTYGFVSTDQEQQLQIGSVRKLFSFMRLLMNGLGLVRFNMYIDNLFSDYSTTLEPDIEFPRPVSGDIEVPLNETGERAFFEFVTKNVGTGFNISKVNVGLRQDPWSPVRGRND